MTFFNQWEHDKEILNSGFCLESISSLYKNKPNATETTRSKHTQKRTADSLQQVHIEVQTSNYPQQVFLIRAFRTYRQIDPSGAKYFPEHPASKGKRKLHL